VLLLGAGTRSGPGPGAGSTTTTTGTYGYDADGNTTTRDVGSDQHTLAWDDEGNLSGDTVSNSSGQSLTSYIYDADGNRLIETSPTQTTLYLGATQITLAAGSSTPKATRYYDLGGGNQAVRTDDNKVTFELSDAQGTAQVSVAASDQAMQERRTDPFGNIRGTAPTTWIGTKGFVGGTQDTTTGLTWLGARDYDPTTGRFTSADPLLDTDKPQQLNGYSYSGDNPVTFSDPTGNDYGCGKDQGSCGPNDELGGGPVETIIPASTYPVSSCAPLCASGFGYGGYGAAQAWQATHPQPRVQGREGDYWAGVGVGLVRLADTATTPLDIDCDVAKIFGHCHPGDDAENWFREMGVNTDSEDYDLGEQQGESVGADVLLGIGGEEGEPGGKCSFSSNTLVLMGDGKKEPISKLKPGEKVQAADPDTGKHDPSSHTVTATHINHDNDLLNLTVRTSSGHPSTLHTTSNHPF
jgi:RHS repeat-associated protein